jgi:uncharacterized membrane-anchored protein YhcB (DUF1043 family)
LLGLFLTAVVCLVAGVLIGVLQMRYEAIKYGHAETGYILEGKYVHQWRWKQPPGGE